MRERIEDEMERRHKREIEERLSEQIRRIEGEKRDWADEALMKENERMKRAMSRLQEERDEAREKEEEMRSETAELREECRELRRKVKKLEYILYGKSKQQ